jgi:uncharacterized protein YkwD
VVGGKKDVGRRLPFKVSAVVLAATATALALTVSVAVGAKPEASCPDAGRAPSQASVHFLRSSVLCLVNRIRETRGLVPLEYNVELRDSATAHSRDMVANGYFSHYGPSQSTPLARATRFGYYRGGPAVVGENLGWGKGRKRGSPLAIVHAWMHSPEHRVNMLSESFRDFGVGVARGSPLRYSLTAATYTLDFGNRP